MFRGSQGVLSASPKVYQYVGAASRTRGSQNAAATFALAPSDTNPQGIADPPTAGMLLMSAASPLAPNQAPVPAFSAAASSGMSNSAAVQSLATRDAVFALLTPHLDSPPPTSDRSWRPAGTFGGKPFDSLTLLTPASNQDVRSEPSAGGVLEGAWADEDSPVSAAATDFHFTGLAEDAVTEQ
jgi:hypothetical protein